MSIPLSASDLSSIADALTPIEVNPDFTENPVIGRIEVVRPDGDDSTDVVGYFVREGNPNGSGEAWFGYVPAEVTP